MKIEYLIGKKFVFTNKRFSFITTLSIISVVGISIGVASLVVMISVFNGFGKVVSDSMISFDPHVRIENIAEANQIQKIESELNSNKNIYAYSKTLTGKVLAVSNKYSNVGILRGLEETKIKNVTGLEKSIIEGFCEIDNNKVIISVGLAAKLNLYVGDKIKLYSTNDMQNYSIYGIENEVSEGIVAGIFRSGNKLYDANYIFANIKLNESIFGDNSSYGYDLRLHEIENSDLVKNELSMNGLNSTKIFTWYDLHRDLFSIMKIERWSAFIILLLIIVVAICNLVGSLSMTVISKINDIGLLRALGMQSGGIGKIFRIQAILIGFWGTITGIFIGLIIVYLQNAFSFYKLDPTIYIIPAIPVSVEAADILLIATISILLSVIASIIPVKQANKINPIEALRYE